jgi:aspartate/methionine/tyrosine aminotransferase
MELTKSEHLTQFRAMINPDQRALYFKANINPQVVNLSTAENVLLLDFLQQKAFVNLGPITATTIRYPSDIYASSDYRESVQSFLQHQWNVTVSADNIFAVSGVVAGLEVLALALFKPGDEVLIPTPMWYGFPWSFCQNPGMKLVPFPIDGGVNLTVADVERAVAKNPNAKLLVMTNPHNPLGINYPKPLLEGIYSSFLSVPGRHIISDEIYACSQVKNKNEFVSALNLDAYQQYSDRIHVTWGLSKDFGLAGFRAAFIISRSPEVQKFILGDSCNASAIWFSPFVALNPYMTRRLFFNDAGQPDPQLANDAMVAYKGLLEKQYAQVAQRLQAGNIGYYQGNHGALFFWIDLRPYLSRVPVDVSDQPRLCPKLYDHDSLREARLANYISEKAGVLLVRGQECFNAEPGYFRLCYTAEPLDQVTQGIDTMVQVLKALPH